MSDCLDGNVCYINNCFITDWDNFEKYYLFLFGIIEELSIYDEIFRLFEAVRRMGLTSLFICEMTGVDKKQFGEYGVEDYLSDGVIHLTMERTGDEISRKLAIIKMRHTSHALGYRPFKWDQDNQKFTIN